MAQGNKSTTLYLMQAKVCKGLVNATKNDDSFEIWHKRLGHMSQRGIDHLAKKNLFPRINGIPLKSCVDCIASKQNYIFFKCASPFRKQNILDLVHSNICGPFNL